MNGLEFNALLPFIAAGSYLLLLVLALIRRSQKPALTRWFSAFLVISILWEFILILGSETSQVINASIKFSLINTVLLGNIAAIYADRTRRKEWLLAGSSGLLLAMIADLVVPNRGLTLPGTSSLRITYSGLSSHLIWLALAGYTLIRSWKDFRSTIFPWHANRLLFWLLALLLTFVGEALLFFRWTGLTAAGQIVRFAGSVAIAYAISSHRMLDVRTRSQRLLAVLLITLVSGLPLAGAIAAVQWLARDQSLSAIILLTIITATVGFFFYEPYRRAVERIAFRYLPGQEIATSKAVRNYSQAVYKTLDVNQLAAVITSTLNQLLDTELSTLMLVSETNTGWEIKPIAEPGVTPLRPLQLSPLSPLVSGLLQHQPLLQYELDFNPEYSGISTKEQQWLKQLAMEVYVPIVADTALTGLIAIGPTSTGLPYQPGELELAQILADQTVVALQNSRLYSELASQNAKIRSLNVDLTDQNERLEIMDRVKSDFIAIASHELRTPLTQVKGYADILSTMNEEDALSLEQIRGILDLISQASDRLETLISAMLDTSELDIDEMALTFTQQNLSKVVKEALEPFQPAIRQRRLTFSSQGINTLPSIEADHKRLVQAFSNLIGNAIKYTPDDGNISIQASSVPSRQDRDEYVEVVIADKGIGIDPKYQELIFEKFFRIGDSQLHSTSDTKFKGAGPGLGLHIARGVIEAHGGRIWVESEGEDEQRLPGSRFHIILPVHHSATEVD